MYAVCAVRNYITWLAVKIFFFWGGCFFLGVDLLRKTLAASTAYEYSRYTVQNKINNSADTGYSLYEYVCTNNLSNTTKNILGPKMFKVVKILLRCDATHLKIPANFAASNQIRFISSSSEDDAKTKKIGIIGMGNVGKNIFRPYILINNALEDNAAISLFHVGDAVLRNLLRNNFLVSAISDSNLEKCKGRGYPTEIGVLATNREVAQDADIIITGMQVKVIN